MVHLESLLSIKRGEGRLALLVVAVMLLTSAGFTLGSTGVEALFFARFGVEYLPYMYMILGTLSFLTSLGITALLGKVRRETIYIFVPIVVAILTVIGWGILFSGLALAYPVLWLGKEVVNSLITLVVWGIAGAVCDARQSKRLFPLFNAGRILGAVLGGLGTGLLVNLIGTQNLLLLWAGLLLLAYACIRVLMREHPIHQADSAPSRKRKNPTSLLREMQRGYQFVRGSSLMKWISIAAILFSILYFSIALPFSKTAAAQYPNENDLAGFLGIFNALSTAAAFLASAFFANRLYAKIGIMNALLALPVIYLIGFGGLVLTDAFIIVILFRFFQMLWLSGIADSAYQAMFNAIPAARRDQVRAFIDGVPSQAGTFIAGLILFIGEQSFSSQQLAIAGLSAAIATTFVIWRAGRAYNFALVESLRKGRPNLFDSGSQPDAAMLNIALEGMKHTDAVVRRISVEIIGRSSTLSTTEAVVQALQDEDADVRLTALKGLTRLQASSALLEIAALLSDPQPAVRAQAVDSLLALTPYSHSLHVLLPPLLEDKESLVQVRAMVALLSIDPSHPSRGQLRHMSMAGNEDQRILALNGLAEAGDPNAFLLFTNELNDENAPTAVRCAATSALGSCGAQAIPELTKALASKNLAFKSSAASALGKIGEVTLPEVLDALTDPASEYGALLALEQLPAWKEAERIRSYAKSRIDLSIRLDELRLSIQNIENDRMQLLADSLQHRARRCSINSLMALKLLTDRETISIAIDSLQSNNSIQISNALEALESTREAALLRPALQLWERKRESRSPMSPQDVLDELMKGQDDWLRSCAAFAAENYSKENQMENPVTLSIMERVLLLRRVPLLSVLPPPDLQRVAEISTEHEFTDGEVMCEQGELGDEMYVITSGEVRIMIGEGGKQENEIARRTAGDVVGEMSIISGDTRMASVIADGDVRVLCLDRLSFESLLRERPEVSLALMQNLCDRLKQVTHELGHFHNTANSFSDR
ncbi:MAG: HEAT repeat domain-containing protein [Anaerolineales bacterium]|nr:HEAT repeat domain-containing protein [Anaerolineales bacterium]